MNETLLGIAQLNVAIAGFSGLILLLQNSDELSIVNRNRFRVMIRGSLSAAIACAVALALLENLSANHAAMISSVIYLLIIIFNVVSGIGSREAPVQEESTLSGRLFFGGMMICNVFVQAANLFLFQNMEIFLIGPVIALVMAALLFLRLLSDISRAA